MIAHRAGESLEKVMVELKDGNVALMLVSIPFRCVAVAVAVF
jgi:hypothetical protein